MRTHPLFRMLLLVFFSFLCLSNPIASAFAETGSFPPTIRDILDQGHITIAMTQNDMPPFYFKDASGRLNGIDVMLAKGIAERLGVRAVFNREATSFNGVVDLVVEGKADIAVSKLSRTLDRAKVIRYTEPYIVFRQGLLINRLGLAKKTQRMSEYEFIKNFTGKLGVIQASSYVGYARENFPTAEIV
ncbi:MAG: transporter substrate-binding domain-containing protein, partial [Thermodesulfobacteriota bacterium]